MNWQQIFTSLTETERQEMTRLLIQRLERPRRIPRLRHLRPIHLLFPSTLAQLAVLVWSVLSPPELLLSRLMAGYITVAALAVVPVQYARPRLLKAHWIR